MRKLIIIAVGGLLLAMGAGAGAQDLDADIAGAEHAASQAQSRLDALEAQIGLLYAELSEVEANEKRLVGTMLATQRRQRILWARLQDAREILAHRAAAAYQVGPAATLEVILSVRSPSELASAQAYTERAFGSDTDLIATVENRRTQADINLALLREQRQAIDADRVRVRALIDEIGARIDEAEAVADSANLRVAQLHERRRQIQEAAAREALRKALIDRAGGGGPWSADWDAIAMCESSGNWAANTGNGYWGGLQFHPSTWYAHGGGPFSGKGPFPYSREEQIIVAERVLDSQGPGAWPHCYRSA